MASQPPTLPESIILSRFSGLKNTVTPERLTTEELEAAVNVDIDDVGQLHRRRGYTQVDNASYHSLYKGQDRWLVVKDGSLGLLHPDYSFTAITTGGPDRISYTEVGDITYFSSPVASGKIDADGAYSAWGADASAGTWLSPVLTPTDTLGAIGGRLLGAPPMATDICYFRGRIYLAHGRTVWATELFLYDYVDKTKGYLHFEHDVTLLAPADDGLYVGTAGGLYFLNGVFGAGQKRDIVSDAAVIPGSGVMTPANRVDPQARQGPIPDAGAIVMLTADGVCAALDGGRVFNLTQGRVVFPGILAARAMYREQDGMSSYVAVADSGGDPLNSARLGDYVDAEIIRAPGA